MGGEAAEGVVGGEGVGCVCCGGEGEGGREGG